MAEDQTEASPSFTRVFASTLDSVDEAEESVLKLAGEMGFAEDDLHKLGMAVREAMVNAVVHGNRYDVNKKIHFAAVAKGSELRVSITDEGTGFDATSLPDPLAEENLLRQSGRGLLLIKAFVDEFEMRKAPPLGTEIRLSKRKQS